MILGDLASCGCPGAFIWRWSNRTEEVYFLARLTGLGSSWQELATVRYEPFPTELSSSGMNIHTHIYNIRLVLVSTMLYCTIAPSRWQKHSNEDRAICEALWPKSNHGKKWKNTDVGKAWESGKLYKEWNDVKRTLYATGITTSSKAMPPGNVWNNRSKSAVAQLRDRPVS